MSIDYIRHYKTIKKPTKSDNLRGYGCFWIVLDADIAPRSGIEPLTYPLGGDRSILLSYRGGTAISLT